MLFRSGMIMETGQSDTVWLALKVEEEAMSQGMLAASKEGEGKGADSLLEPPGRNPALG